MTERKKHGALFHLLDVALNVIVIIAIVTGIRTFLVSPFQVDGSSMSSTLENKEYIIINKLAFFIGNPIRGDIVVFHPPNEPSKYYVKRVIGMPGDTVILRDGYVYIKNASSSKEVKIDEPYLDERNLGKTFDHPAGSGRETTYKVPEDHYFLLGDNRQGSLDSRSFADIDHNPLPFVSRESIKGRVWVVALPVTKIHELAKPAYTI